MDQQLETWEPREMEVRIVLKTGNWLKVYYKVIRTWGTLIYLKTKHYPFPP